MDGISWNFMWDYMWIQTDLWQIEASTI
jgi:hypothetical protein